MSRSRSKVTYGHPEPEPIPGKLFIEVGDGSFAIIDAADFKLVQPFKWSLNPKGEVIANVSNGVYSSKLLMKVVVLMKRAEKGFAVKYLDGNSLNCSRSNLKLMTLVEARALDKQILGPMIRAQKVITKDIRKILNVKSDEPKKKVRFKIGE